MTQSSDKLLNRKKYIGGLLEMGCQELELPESRRKTAEIAYNSVGSWLSGCPTMGSLEPVVFAQGSIALGTTVKPLRQEEFDVDLICNLTLGNEQLSQSGVKRAVGDRLGAHSTYRDMLEEFKRCWRLNYAPESQLHLDITPAVKNSRCCNGGLCVTDKEARVWRPSNPKGYADRFNERAALRPRFREAAVLNRREQLSAKAEIEPFPEHTPLKGLLRRTVQLVKRHRCVHFEDQPEKAPISIVLTTLVAKAYEAAVVSGRVYDTELDLVCDVIAHMPDFIERRWNNDRIELWVPNETTDGENFAEKWNKDSALVDAFYEWHGKAVNHFTSLASAADAEGTFLILNSIAGKKTSGAVRNRAVQAVNHARVQGVLRTGTSGGLGVVTGVPVVANTFFGE